MDHIDEDLEGLTLGELGESRCDKCSQYFKDGEEVVGYASDVILNSDKEHGLGMQRVYCHECRRDAILYPTAMADEALYEFTLFEDNTGMLVIYDVRPIDESPHGDGVNWDPRDVWEAVASVTFDASLGQLPYQTVAVGPEDISDGLNNAGLDVADLVDWRTGEVKGDVDVEVEPDDIM